VFTLAANGGGELLLSYTKSGYIEVHREVNAPWQDYAAVPDVVMSPADTAATFVDLSAASVSIHRATAVSDASGTRQATLLVMPGTTAEMTFPNGSGQSLSTFTVRATELTVGATGPEAMPQLLPPTSGYTYALELNADEAWDDHLPAPRKQQCQEQRRSDGKPDERWRARVLVRRVRVTRMRGLRRNPNRQPGGSAHRHHDDVAHRPWNHRVQCDTHFGRPPSLTP